MIEKGANFPFPNEQCLTCKRRVGSHSYEEFGNCLAAQGISLLPRYGDDEE
jgi:hypothetical protein